MKEVAISRVDKILRREITTVSTAEKKKKKNSSAFLRGFENALTGYVCVCCVYVCVYMSSLCLMYLFSRLFIIENIIFIEQSSMKIHFQRNARKDILIFRTFFLNICVVRVSNVRETELRKYRALFIKRASRSLIDLRYFTAISLIINRIVVLTTREILSSVQRFHARLHMCVCVSCVCMIIIILIYIIIIVIIIIIIIIRRDCSIEGTPTFMS